MKKHSSTTLSVLAIALSCTMPAHAAVLTWDGGGGTTDWSTSTNWDTNNAPVAADVMVIGGTSVVDFNTTFTSSQPNGVTVIDINDSAQLNLTGGSLTVADGNSNTSSIAIAANAVLNISGGTHNLYGRMSVSEPGTIRVTGDDATINLRQVAGFNSGSYEFIFDDTGVSSLDYYSYLNPNSNNLYVDVSAYMDAYSGPYVVGGTRFDLINTGTLLGNTFQASNITLVGLGEEGNTNYGYILNQDATDVYLTVFVPEPSSTALLGLGLSSMLLRRRR